jgi:hypothetical protein
MEEEIPKYKGMQTASSGLVLCFEMDTVLISIEVN